MRTALPINEAVKDNDEDEAAEKCDEVSEENDDEGIEGHITSARKSQDCITRNA